MAERGKRGARRKVARALEEGLAGVDSDKAAEETLAGLEQKTKGVRQGDVAKKKPADPAGVAAAKIARAARKRKKTAAILEQTAQEIAQEPSPDEAQPIDEGIEEAAREEENEPAAVRQGRRRLRKQLFRRLGPLQALDAALFTQINELPHPPVVDRAVSRFSRYMTGGHAWALVLLAAALHDPARSRRATLGVMPALWLTTLTVEQVIKRFFRRRRPFISIVQAIVVGRKPGSYSFPSGHTAAAFAGAVLLIPVLPGRREIFPFCGGPGRVLAHLSRGALSGRRPERRPHRPGPGAHLPAPFPRGHRAGTAPACPGGKDHSRGAPGKPGLSRATGRWRTA